MSVWVLKPEGGWDSNSQEQSWLPLPFRGIPDLSGVGSEAGMRNLLTLVYPDWPPERVMRQAETYWRNVSQLARGDFIVVPMVGGECALGEVVTRYRYRVEEGKDVHEVEVKWQERDISARRLSMLQAMLSNGIAMQLVEHADARKQVYGLLKRSYNRFVGWRWLAGVLIVMQIIVMLAGMMRS